MFFRNRGSLLKSCARICSLAVGCQAATGNCSGMNLSGLERISRALEKSLDGWGVVLIVATGIVVLGLVAEYWHEGKELLVLYRWPVASFLWERFKQLSGGVLVALGVTLELFSTYKAGRVETKLRD
jgi:hypothetical protein